MKKWLTIFLCTCYYLKFVRYTDNDKTMSALFLSNYTTMGLVGISTAPIDNENDL